jgi:uncharacterized protein
MGVGAPRMEIARVERRGRHLVADGTQLGSAYELRYRLEPGLLALELVGERSLDVELRGADFFDLGYSPLFNSLPIMRDGLLEAGPPRVYVMRWVEVPSLELRRSEQRYEPLGNAVVRFQTEGFTADIQFDAAGFVLDYPGLAHRV